jgi:hypothetical protein
MAFLRDEYLQSSLRNMKIFSALERITGVLCRQGIDVLLLKGAHLARFVYPREATRPMADADIMVRSADFARSVALMQGAGFKVHAEPHLASASPPHIAHVSLASRTGTVIEVHRTFDLSRPGSPVDIEGVWARAETIRLNGADARVMCPEDAVLHLCMHAAMQHAFCLGLPVLCDVDAILTRRGSVFDWNMLVRRAQEWRMTRGAWVTLALCHELLGVMIPGEIVRALQPAPPREPILEAARARLLEGKPRDAASWTMLKRIAVPPPTGSRLRALGRQLFMPPGELARRSGVPAGSCRVAACYARRLGALTRTYLPLLWRLARGERATRASARGVRDEAALKRWLRSE